MTDRIRTRNPSFPFLVLAALSLMGAASVADQVIVQGARFFFMGIAIGIWSTAGFYHFVVLRKERQ